MAKDSWSQTLVLGAMLLTLPLVLLAAPYPDEDKLIASDGVAGDYFGSSVAQDGATLVVGAHGHSDNGWFAGSVYVFTRGCNPSRALS